MSQTAEKKEVAVVEPQEAATNIIQVIERAAMNPDVDIDKMERLLQMQERILDRQAAMAFASAFSEMQPELPEIPKRGKSHNGKYALWEDINDLIRPILGEHGFGLSFRTRDVEDGVEITAILTHSGGHSRETPMTFPADKSGSKNDVQAIGSSMSYGKRYTAEAILNLTSRGEDDDGVRAGSGEKITQEQAAELNEIADDLGANKIKFCKMHKVESLADISADKFEPAKKALQAYGEKHGVRQ